MDRKAWPVVALVLAHVLEPVAMVLSAIAWDVPTGLLDPAGILIPSPRNLVLLLPFPLVGVAILFLRKWGLATAFLIQISALALHVQFQRGGVDTFPVWALATINLLDLAVVAYFFLSVVRTRYLVHWKASATQEGRTFDLVISNISERGALVLCRSAPVKADAPIHLDFEARKTAFSLEGEVRHHRGSGEVGVYGIQFRNLSYDQKLELKNLMWSLRSLHYRLYRADEPRLQMMLRILKSFFAFPPKNENLGTTATEEETEKKRAS